MINGKSLDDVIIDDFQTYARYRNGFKDLDRVLNKRRAKKYRPIEVEVLYGPTGTGKTTRAMKEADFKIEGSRLEWWDGYDGEKVIVIDEYNNDVKITRLLNILDNWKLSLPVKGGFTQAKYEKVIITTNLTPEEFHNQAKECHRKALFRRINRWIEVVPKCSGVILDPELSDEE
jgi:hypothetical protein